MKCPQCNEPLLQADRKGVEVKFCRHCKGVWLNRQELDKIVEHSALYLPRTTTGVSPGGRRGFLSHFFDFD